MFNETTFFLLSYVQHYIQMNWVVNAGSRYIIIAVTVLVSAKSKYLRHIARIKNSVVLVRKRTIPTERPQPVGEVSANFSW
jgi:hypothetical protein